MYINEVISYLGAWEKFNKNHISLLEDLNQAFHNIQSNSKKMYSENEDELNYSTVRDLFNNELLNLDWSDERAINLTINDSRKVFNLGLSKDDCFIRFSHNMITTPGLMTWIYSDIELANKNSQISIPILIVTDFSTQEFFEKDENNNLEKQERKTKNSLKFIKRRLENISPLKFEYPFLIIGVGLYNYPIDLTEIEHENKNEKNIKIDRCITFKPEYYQAGLGILNYFGTVLRDKYPDQNATVKIEQHDLTVRMIVETEDGSIETLEKALHEYELVLKGEINADEFYLSPIKALELKTQLRIFELQIESQKDLIALQKGMIIDLKQLASQALSKPPLTIINQLHNSQSTVINHKTEFTESNDELEDLIDLADSDALKNRLSTIQNALEVNRNADQPEEVKDSSGMKKLAKFLKEANEVGTEANNLATKSGEALGLIKNLGRRYNSIAEWCGMPVIPSVLVKE